MSNYIYPNDGRLHSRYSELSNCTTVKGAIRTARTRLGLKPRMANRYTEFGSMRHDMWKAETERTGQSAQVFADYCGFQVSPQLVEQEMVTEAFPGVVVHFTCDAIAAPTLVDYKTATGVGNNYAKSLQLPTYAWLLRPHGIKITDGYYLIEEWDRDRKEVRGYHAHHQPIGVKEMAQAKRFLKTTVPLLRSALEQIDRQDNGIADILMTELEIAHDNIIKEKRQ